MSEPPKKKAVKHLKEMRKEMREGFDKVNDNIDDIALIMTMLASHYQIIEDRLTALEDRQET